MEFLVELWPLTKSTTSGELETSQSIGNDIAQKLSIKHQEGWIFTHVVPVSHTLNGGITQAYYHFQRSAHSS